MKQNLCKRAAVLMALGALVAVPGRVHADPPANKGKPTKGKGDTIPIKVEPPIITKDPKAPAPPPPPKKKDS